MTTQEFLKGALSKAASTATRLVPQIKPAVAVAKGVMNEVSKTPPVQPGQVLKTAANMAVNTNPAVAVAKSLYTPTAAGAKSAVSSLATAMKPAQASGPSSMGPMSSVNQNQSKSIPSPLISQNPAAIRPPVPANPPGQTALSTPGSGFTSTDPTIRAQVEAMSRSAAQPTAPIRPPVESTPDIKSLSMAAVSNNDRAAQIKALNDAYTRSLQLSPEEEAKQQQLDAISQRQALLRQSYNEGDSNIRNQAIPMQFVTGQQAALQRQYTNQQEGIAAESLPLKDQLALLQQRRAANQAAAKANLDFEQAQYKTEQEKSKPIEVGGSLIQYDPATETYKTLFSKPQEVAKPEIREANGVIYERQNDGTWKSVAGSPKSQSDAGFTLGEGQVRYDANGNLVASGPAKTVADKAPTEFQSTSAGFAVRLQDANNILDGLGNSGYFAPLGRDVPNLLKTADQQRREQAERNFINATLRRESGASISPQEFENAKLQYFPQFGDSEAVLEQKAQNRKRIEQSFILNSGPVYQQMQGQGGGQSNGQRSSAGDPLDSALDSVGFKSAATVQAKNGSDARVEKLARAIAQHETGNRNIAGQTGETISRYQFMPDTWRILATKYLGNGKAPLSDANQDLVAKSYISDLFRQGYDERQIAMIWNGGVPRRKVGTTKTTSGKTISYDTGRYADNVLAIYNSKA